MSDYGMYDNISFQKIILDPEKRKALEWWADTLDKDVTYTPDAMVVEQYEDQKVFLPDVFKKGQNFHFAVKVGETAQYRLPAYTEDKFMYWNVKNPWSLPVPLEVLDKKDYKGVGARPAQIMGELWTVSPHGLFYLDSQYKNGVEFERKRVKLLVRTRDIIAPTVANNLLKQDAQGKYYYEHNVQNTSDWKYTKVGCWMYVGKRSFWDDKIDGGYEFEPVKIFKPNAPDLQENIPEYYFYNEKVK